MPSRSSTPASGRHRSAVETTARQGVVSRVARSKALRLCLVLSLLLIPSIPAKAATVPVKPGKNKVVLTKKSFANGAASVSFVVPAFKGPAIYLGVQLRTKSNKNAYRARLKITKTGAMLVGFSRTVKGKDKRLTSVRVPGRVRPGQRVYLNAAIRGSKPVKLWVRAWIHGENRPNWQKTYSDRSSKRIKGSGKIGAWAYLSKASPKATKLTYNKLGGMSAAAAAKAAAKRAAAAQKTASSTTPRPGVPASPEAPPINSGGAKPSAANTGVPAGVALTRHNGNIIVTKDGTVLDKLDIYGYVEVRANNVKITNSRIRGGTGASNNIGMITNYKGSNLVIEDTDIMADNESIWVDGIKGWNFTARRVHVVGGVDSIKIQGDNVRVEDSLLENTNYFAKDPAQNNGPTHNDNIQILKGRNISIIGNTIRGAQTHTVLATAQQGEARVVIANNWLDGAICNVKLQASGSYWLAATVTGNKFGPNRVYQKCKISEQASGNITLAQSGNTMEADGSSVGVLME